MFFFVVILNFVVILFVYKVSVFEVFFDVFFLLLSFLSIDRCFRFVYNFYILFIGVIMYEDVEVVFEVIVVL